jgi:hypothetical protein
MKFNISLKVLPLLACGMLMASCNDFLKQEPLTDITPTDYYKDATQLQAVANAFYQTVLPHSFREFGRGIHELKGQGDRAGHPWARSIQPRGPQGQSEHG